FNITFPIKQFLIQYGTIHGFPSPLRHQDDSGVFIYLPTGQTFVLVYNEYKKNFYLTHTNQKKSFLILPLEDYGMKCLEIGKVYISKKSDREETSFQLLHNNNFDAN
ncbi:897_t:CDS:2, partial [Dentiscutata erythropus]